VKNKLNPHQKQILEAIDRLKLTPIPIPTIGKSFFGRTRQWMTASRKWKIAESWKIDLDIKGRRQTVFIPAGFVFDGASIPRLLWPVLSPTGILLVPSLIHDYGYRHGHLLIHDSHFFAPEEYYHKTPRSFWDEVFLEVAKQVTGCNVIPHSAWSMLVAFGGFAWRRNRKLEKRREEAAFMDILGDNGRRASAAGANLRSSLSFTGSGGKKEEDRENNR
jgi:hypothetical protein